MTDTASVHPSMGGADVGSVGPTEHSIAPTVTSTGGPEPGVNPYGPVSRGGAAGRDGEGHSPPGLSRNESSTENLFGPNRSALSMLKQLKFSPFVAGQMRARNLSGTNGGDNGDGPGSSSDARGGGADHRGRFAATSPWEFFTPTMLQWYAIFSYAFAAMLFSCSIACIVLRYRSKPNTPIECDPRLDRTLSGLAGLQMPASIFVPVWMAIFSEHVYPPLYQASRVPLERTFRFFNYFVLYSTFLSLVLVAIFGLSLYALSVAKKWDFVEHEACGSAFSVVRGVAIADIVFFGFILIGHFSHWAYLNSKLEDVRGQIRPIPSG